MHGKALREPFDIELAALAFQEELMMDKRHEVGEPFVPTTRDIAQSRRGRTAENIAGNALVQRDGHIEMHDPERIRPDGLPSHLVRPVCLCQKEIAAPHIGGLPFPIEISLLDDRLPDMTQTTSGSATAGTRNGSWF